MSRIVAPSFQETLRIGKMQRYQMDYYEPNSIVGRYFRSRRTHKWQKITKPNLVTTAGQGRALDLLFNLSSITLITPFVGLVSGATPTFNVADTLASHAGWTEFTSYSGNRKTYTGVRSGNDVTNAASVASFTMSGSGTIGGAFLATVNTGTSGTLISEADGDGDEVVASAGVLEVIGLWSLDDDGV